MVKNDPKNLPQIGRIERIFKGQQLSTIKNNYYYGNSKIDAGDREYLRTHRRLSLPHE